MKQLPIIHDIKKDLVFFDGPGHEMRRVDWNNIDDVRQVIKLWADNQFPKRTAYSALCKLTMEEIPEFLMAQDSPGEYADLLILIFDIASLRGIDIAKALEEKMKINMQRKWLWDKETGKAHHV